MRMARDRRPRTPLQYWLYVAVFFGFYAPWKPCCPGHDTPFDMMWSLWTEDPQSFIAIGSRSSFKTLGLGISEVMDLVFKGCGIAHIGAIEAQALKCYSYVRKGLRKYPDLLDRPPLLSKTELNNGGRLEILPCTLNRVNSPHEPKVRFDEVELADPLAYHDAKFIASTDEKNTAASIVYTSTRKFAYGLAQKEIERAIADQQRVFIWCFKDVTERCSDERSGVIPTVYHIDPEKLLFSPIPTEQSKEYLLFNKCGKCPIIATCRGDLKRANGIKPIEDIITIFRDATIDTWLAQMECKRPMRQGLVLYNFSEKNFVPIEWDMFKNAEGEFNHNRFTQLWGKDWGWNPDVTIIGVLDRFKQTLYVVKEFYYSAKTTPIVAKELMAQWVRGTFFGLPEDIVCDKSEPGLIRLFQDSGFDMATAPEENDVEFGIDLLNTLAADPNAGGQPRIFVDSKMCPGLYQEITEGYRRKLDPRTNEPGEAVVKKNDHGCDALRYMVTKHLAPRGGIVGQYVGATSSLEEQLASGEEVAGNDMDMLLMLAQQHDDDHY